MFMVPVPYRVETGLSYPLQRIATKISVYTLQMLGQPALAEGNTIMLNEIRLEVEQACSGLRIFMGVIALAFAYIIAFRRTWWERAIILLSVVPIALLVNAGRIVATGLLLQQFTGDTARHWVHDVSGWIMIPAAAMFFGFLLWYLQLLFRPVRQVNVKSIIGQEW
jgi:exosortase